MIMVMRAKLAGAFAVSADVHMLMAFFVTASTAPVVAVIVFMRVFLCHHTFLLHMNICSFIHMYYNIYHFLVNPFCKNFNVICQIVAQQAFAMQQTLTAAQP